MYQIDPIELCEFYHGEKTNPFDEIVYAPDAEMLEDYDEIRNKAMFWFYEFCWARTSRREELLSWCEDAIGAGLQNYRRHEGVPFSLIGLLYNRFSHWDCGKPEAFKEWFEKHYIGNMPKRSKGERILKQHRQILFDQQQTPEYTRPSKFTKQIEAIVTAVDGGGYDGRISEKKMARALGYADVHGLHVIIVPDSKNMSRRDGWTYHPEFKEITAIAKRVLRKEGDCYVDSVEYIGRWNKNYVYRGYLAEEALNPEISYNVGFPACILIPDKGEPVFFRSPEVFDIINKTRPI